MQLQYTAPITAVLAMLRCFQPGHPIATDPVCPRPGTYYVHPGNSGACRTEIPIALENVHNIARDAVLDLLLHPDHKFDPSLDFTRKVFRTIFKIDDDDQLNQVKLRLSAIPLLNIPVSNSAESDVKFFCDAHRLQREFPTGEHIGDAGSRNLWARCHEEDGETPGFTFRDDHPFLSRQPPKPAPHDGWLRYQSLWTPESNPIRRGIQFCQSLAARDTADMFMNDGFNGSTPILGRVRAQTEVMGREMSEENHRNMFEDKPYAHFIDGVRELPGPKMLHRFLESFESALLHELTHGYWGFGTVDKKYNWNGVRTLAAEEGVENADSIRNWGMFASYLAGRWRITDWVTQE